MLVMRGSIFTGLSHAPSLLVMRALILVKFNLVCHRYRKQDVLLEILFLIDDFEAKIIQDPQPRYQAECSTRSFQADSIVISIL